MKKVNLVLLLGALALVGCTQQEKHEHSFANEWSTSAEKHWKACTGEECTEVSESADHTFVWVTDTQPSYSAAGSKHEECSVCGYKKDAVGIDQLVHTYAAEWSQDANKHWKACTDAGFTTLKGDEADHDWKEVVDSDATYEKAGSKHNECKICGYKQAATTIPQLVHNYASTWSKDATNHWKACTDAGFATLKKDEGAHTMVADTSKTDVPATETTVGTHYIKCSTCGYQSSEEIQKITHNHTYANTWSTNETNHWHAATCAHTTLKSDDAAHSFGDPVYSGGKKTVTCSVCGYVKSEVSLSKTLTVEAEDSAVYNAATTATYMENDVQKTCVYIAEPAEASNYRGISFTVYSESEQTVKYTIKAGYEYGQTAAVENTYGLSINGRILKTSDTESAGTTIAIVQATKTSHTDVDPTKFIESEVGSYTLRAGYNSFLVYSNSTVYNYILLDNIKLEGTAGLDLVKYEETNTKLIKDCTSINKQESGSADFPYFGTTTGTGYFEFTVNATRATTVELVFYVLYRTNTANSGQSVPYKENALTMCKFYVNGTQITSSDNNAAGALPLVKVSDDNSTGKRFARVPLAFVALNQGANTIRMEFYPGSHGNQNTWKMDVLSLDAGIVTIA